MESKESKAKEHDHSAIKNSESATMEHKPTKKELDTLREEVLRQNRMLLGVCAVVIVLALAIFFGFQTFKAHLKPAEWTYENAVLDVYKGNINSNQYPYEGFIFARQSNASLWTFQGNINGSVYQITTYYSPNELLDINLSDRTLAQIFTKPYIVLTLNSSLDNVAGAAANAAIAAIELGKVLGNKNGILNKITRATTTTGDPTAPANDTFAVSCANATTVVGVIQIELGDKTEVSAAPHCAIVRGSSPEEIIRAADRLMFGLLHMMPIDKYVYPTVQNKTVSVGSNFTNSSVNGTTQ